MKSKVYSNINTKVKFAGTIDYKTLAIFIAVIFLICSISSLFNLGFKITFILICIFLPFGCVLLFCNTKNEDSLCVIQNIIRYYLNKKIYVKDYNEIKRSIKLFGKIFVKDKNYINKIKEGNSSFINKIITLVKNAIFKIKNRTNI